MLKPGLYEQVVSHQLGKELDAASDKLSQTVQIDAAEASRVLAKCCVLRQVERTTARH